MAFSQEFPSRLGVAGEMIGTNDGRLETVCKMVGAEETLKVGRTDGSLLDEAEGRSDGVTDGSKFDQLVGRSEGLATGSTNGPVLGESEGVEEELAEGTEIGELLGPGD